MNGINSFDHIERARQIIVYADGGIAVSGGLVLRTAEERAKALWVACQWSDNGAQAVFDGDCYFFDKPAHMEGK